MGNGDVGLSTPPIWVELSTKIGESVFGQGFVK